MKRLVVVVVCAIALFSVAIPAASAQSKKPRVLVVGDSITYLARTQIRAALRRDFAAGIQAINETPMSFWAPFLAKHATPKAKLDWVIELGTDDGPVKWQGDFTHEVAQLAAQKCVVRITINPRARSYGQALDHEMQQTALTKPNFHVLDWGNIEFDQAGWLESDGVHPSTAGRVELGQLERTALLSDCSGT